MPSLGNDCFCDNLFSWIDRAALLVSSKTLEADNAVDLREQGVIAAAADIDSGMDLRAALAVKDVASKDELTVSSLRPKSFGLGISSVFS